MRLSFFRGAVLGAALAALALLSTTALAGSGVGGVFNLGVTNTVDATSKLNGTATSSMLDVSNAGTDANSNGIVGRSASPLAPALAGVNSGGGSGLKGSSTSGAGLYGQSTTGLGARLITGGALPALKATNTGTGPATAFEAGGSAPPFTVNSSTLVSGLNAGLLGGLHASDFWQLGGNAGTDPATNYLGTSDNQPLNMKVNGLRALHLESGSDPAFPNAPNLVGGFSGNSVGASVSGATIGGGGRSGASNVVTADAATVAGGGSNTAGGYDATVGGGFYNTAGNADTTVAGGISNTAGNEKASVGGGQSNTAGSSYSTVGGGQSNTTSGNYASIGGGTSNAASGYAASIVGGSHNAAQGMESFAAGYRAKANEDGTFVWADSTPFDYVSNGANTFNVRATGGLYLTTGLDISGNPDPTHTLTMGPGGNLGLGTAPIPYWGAGLTTSGPIRAGQGNQSACDIYVADDICFYDEQNSTLSVKNFAGTAYATVKAAGFAAASDRAVKKDFTKVSSDAVLRALATLPIQSWSFKADRSGARHIGPMAQDFAKAFHVGADNKHIDLLDGQGVNMAATQALYRMVQKQQRQISVLQAQVRSLQRAH